MKNSRQLLKEIHILNTKNQELRKQLHAAKDSLTAIKKGNVDALVVAHNKSLKIFTEQTADKTYRILVEKMHEGAVTLNREGIILYCNSHFANMVCLPLQKVIGATFKKFIENASHIIFRDLFKKGWRGYSQNELDVLTAEGKTISVLMSVNTLSLEYGDVLSIILTDLTLQKKRGHFKSLLIERIINVIDEMDHSDDNNKIKYSVYLSKKLNYDYTYLANIFSEVKGITIQKYIIIRKIEKVKEMLINTGLNITEISYNLQYSNVGHLSNQFKNITGFSPSYYKQLKQKKYSKKA
ncbi:MAG TPA: helix-turn-helix domain-containing protein [Ferruginibacter sp.]|nr:helix-turn-helix domain-containing protein [Ferruginibacter sp.]